MPNDLTWFEDHVNRVREHAHLTNDTELLLACDAVAPLTLHPGYDVVRRALQDAVANLLTDTAGDRELDAVVSAADQVRLAIAHYRAVRRTARQRIGAVIRELDARDRAAGGGAGEPAPAPAPELPVVLADQRGTDRLTLSVALVPDAEAPRVIETVGTLIHRIGVLQDLGDVADEVTVLTTGDAGVALAELRRLCTEHGIELRHVSTAAQLAERGPGTDQGDA
jgi:hypothetical protein